MQTSKWHPDALSTDDDEFAALWRSSPEAMADRFGVRLALLMLCIAAVMMVMQLFSEPNFEKCSALERQSERNACYEQLREQQLRPPAKGASTPALVK